MQAIVDLAQTGSITAFAGDAGISITRVEAEILFNINDRTAEADNDPAWSDLFAKALANCVMAASGYVAPPREVALRQEAWLNSPSGGVGTFFDAHGLRRVCGNSRGLHHADR